MRRATRRLNEAGSLVLAALALLAFVQALWSATASAKSLEDVIPDLYGGDVCTTIQQGVCEPRQLRGLEQFRSLSSVLRSSVPSLPLPSASGSFRFVFDRRFDTYTRTAQNLGPIFAERAETIGRGKAIFDFSYSHADFDTFDGDELDDLAFSDPAFSPAVLARLPAGDRAKVENEVLRTVLNLDISSDSFLLAGAYGITDDIDVSAGLTVNSIRLSVTGTTRIVDPSGTADAFFADSNRFCEADDRIDTRCLHSEVNESKVGTGDVLLRGKWNFLRSDYVDLAAAATLTVPTGGADDFLGFNDPTFTPLLVAAKPYGRLSPHLNAGYSIRSDEDIRQVNWVAGTDVRADDRLTLAFDVLGFHGDEQDGIRNDIYQGSIGFKLNPIGRTVIAGNFQMPLNRDGLRADVIYTVQVEQSF